MAHGYHKLTPEELLAMVDANPTQENLVAAVCCLALRDTSPAEVAVFVGWEQVGWYCSGGPANGRHFFGPSEPPCDHPDRRPVFCPPARDGGQTPAQTL